MAGTRAGGIKAAQKNKLRHGDDFYKNIGHIGGQKGTTGGFASGWKCDGKCNLDHKFGLDHKVAKCAGYKGGRISRRGKKKKEGTSDHRKYLGVF